jgi:hypothetical protein
MEVTDILDDHITNSGPDLGTGTSTNTPGQERPPGNAGIHTPIRSIDNIGLKHSGREQSMEYDRQIREARGCFNDLTAPPPAICSGNPSDVSIPTKSESPTVTRSQSPRASLTPSPNPTSSKTPSLIATKSHSPSRTNSKPATKTPARTDEYWHHEFV